MEKAVCLYNNNMILKRCTFILSDDLLQCHHSWKSSHIYTQSKASNKDLIYSALLWLTLIIMHLNAPWVCPRRSLENIDVKCNELFQESNGGCELVSLFLYHVLKYIVMFYLWLECKLLLWCFCRVNAELSIDYVRHWKKQGKKLDMRFSNIKSMWSNIDEHIHIMCADRREVREHNVVFYSNELLSSSVCETAI